MKVLAENRKAFHEYEIQDKFEAGISLFGYEVKAIREGKANFEGSFIKILNSAPILLNLHIGKYSKQGEEVDDIKEKRDRQLLLKKYEIQRLEAKLKQRGFSLVPLKFIADHGLIKLEFALVKGKKKHDKKLDLKEKQEERDLRREAKEDKRFAG